MKTLRMTSIALGVLLVASVCAAEAPAPATRPDAPATQPAAPATRPSESATKLPDLCQDAVDPYNQGAERARFFRAAGVDNQLADQEAQANQKADQPFVRVFDRWETMTRFDKNGDGQLDWFEVDEYRKAFRQRVLDLFDKNKDGRLTDKEREEANAALARGKLPLSSGGEGDRPAIRVPAPDGPRGGGPGGEVPPGPRGDPRHSDRREGQPDGRDEAFRKQLLEKYDKDGDGQLSDEEAKAAGEDMRDEHEQRLRERFDADGDGRLNGSEQAEMFRQQQGPWRDAVQAWVLADFDADRDGKLDENEIAARKVFEGKMRDLGKEMDVRFNDLNHDGTVSPEERQAVQQELRKAMFGLMIKAGKYMDADRNGQVSTEEREEFMRRTSSTLLDWAVTYREKFDADRNGSLDENERNALVEGLRGEVLTRVDKADANKDGQIDADEVIQLLMEFGKDSGVLKEPGSHDHGPRENRP